VIYEKHLQASELTRLNLATDVAWDAIRPELALAQPDLLAKLRDAAIIESYHPVHIPHLLEALWDDVEATAVLSIELFEGFRHFHGLKSYLDRVGARPPLTEEELVEVRRKAREQHERVRDPIPLLVDFMGSEHFAAFFFARGADEAREPVLRDLLKAFSRDEFRHAQAIADVLQRRLQRQPEGVEDALRAALHFSHYGKAAVEVVPTADEHDLPAIMAFNRRVEQVCGRSLVEYMKQGLRHD
jgi:hypothetical protein